jgi:hypothetical protein
MGEPTSTFGSTHDTARLPQPMTVKAFNGKYNNTVTHILNQNLTLNGGRQADIPFWMLDLHSHDIILGLKWMNHFAI